MKLQAVFSMNADGKIPDTYVTIYNKSERKLQYISTMDPNVEPIIYPLFYPFRTQGWHQNIPSKSDLNKRVSN